MLGLVLTLALLGNASAPEAPPPMSQEDTRVLPVVLDDSIPGVEGVRDELALRLGGRSIVLASSPRDAPPSAFLWAGATPQDDGLLLQVIVSDGRLYQRVVRRPPPGEEARVTAGELANLVEGIAERRLQPTRTAVAVPSLTQTKDVAPPEPTPEPSDEPPRKTPPPPPPTQTRPRPVVASVWATGAWVAGLGPPADLTGTATAGAGLGGAWHHPRGLTVGGSLRAASWQRGGVRMTRARLALQVGYGWTWERWALVVRAGPHVEPLWIDTAVRRPSGPSRPRAPLFGGMATLSPRVQIAEQSGFVLLVGPDLEVAGSFEAATPAGAVRILRDADTPLLRAGGMELGVGLTLEARLRR